MPYFSWIFCRIVYIDISMFYQTICMTFLIGYFWTWNKICPSHETLLIHYSNHHLNQLLHTDKLVEKYLLDHTLTTLDVYLCGHIRFFYKLMRSHGKNLIKTEEAIIDIKGHRNIFPGIHLLVASMNDSM